MAVNIGAVLNKQYGPLKGRHWLIVVGVGGGLIYLYRRSRADALPEDDVSPAATTDTYLGQVGGYGEGYGGLYVSPAPIGSGSGVTPDLQLGESVPISFEFTSEPLEPIFVDCGEGYIMDVFGRCVPDPSLIPVPVPGGGTGGGGQNIQRKIGNINDRIQRLRAGGVTRQERERIQNLRQRRQTLRERRR